MASMNGFLKRLEEETYKVVKEEESKDLAKEDALSLIAEFVKDVKKQFKKSEDRIEILKAAAKTLDFYIDEIAGEESEDFEMGMQSSTDDFEDDDDFEDTEEDL